MIALTPPLPGQYWPAQQAWYAGIQLADDLATGWHLLLPDDPQYTLPAQPWGKPRSKVAGADSPRDGLANTLAMAQAGSPLAMAIRALPGDCYLGSRFEHALLYAALRHQLDLTRWHWTSTQQDASCAWGCGFSNGDQLNYHESFEGSAVAVRRLALQSFDPLAAGAQA